MAWTGIGCLAVFGILVILEGCLGGTLPEPELVCPANTGTVATPCMTVCSTCTDTQLCCDDGCNKICKEGVAPAADYEYKSSQSGLFPFDDVYMVMIGMGIMILLLFVVIIVTLCFYGTAGKK